MEKTKINQYNSWCENIYADIKENNKRIVLIAGASASGKSYGAKYLCDYLSKKGLSATYIQADNYYKGISRILVEKALIEDKDFKKFESLREELILAVKSVIEYTPFGEKFCDENKEKLLNKFSKIAKDNEEYIFNALKKQFDKINFDEPFAVNLNLLTNEINKLLNKQSIILPKYSFATGELSYNNKNIIDGNFDVYIIEGLYCLRNEVINNLNKDDICTCLVDCDLKSLLSRRFNRDIKSGRTSYTPEQTIITTLTKTMPSYLINVLPYNKNATHVLHTSLTSNEINSKEKNNQFKYQLNKAQLNAFKILNLKPQSNIKQEDYYFEDNSNNSNFVLRLRVENGKATKITFKNNIENNRMIEEYDISNFSNQHNSPRFLIEQFINAGLTLDKKICKQRQIYEYKNEKFKLDIFNPNNIFIELDNNKNSQIVDLLLLKDVTNLPYKDMDINNNNNKIHIEKEYKFIVNKLPKNIEKIIKINQFYFNFLNKSDFLTNFLNLSLKNVVSARVRISTENNKTKYILTLKSKGEIEREEQEIEITKEMAIFLLKDNIISKISKTRFITYKNNLNIEFDKFNNGLILAEVELNKNQTYEEVIKTLKELNISFKDVTNNPTYKNENLAKQIKRK